MSSKKKPQGYSSKEIKNDIRNGLSDVLFGSGGPFPTGTQINQDTTLFLNLRNYFISNNRQLLSALYCEKGLIQTIVDVPVDDGFRGGIDVQTDQMDEINIQDLMSNIESSGDLEVVARAMKWARLFGGGAVVILHGSIDNMTMPFDISQIKQDDPVEFKAVDMWELYGDRQAEDSGFNLNMSMDSSFSHYTLFGKKVHKSRVMIIKGQIAPSFLRPRLRGWGLSVVEPIIASINQYLKSTNLAFEVLDEFKVDIFKIKNLSSSLMSGAGEEAVRKRVALANKQKNFQNAIVMDGEDDFSSKELSFTGLAEMLVQIRMQIASDLRMPLTKIFGISATGFSSGQDDIENYNAMIESTIRTKAKFDILKVLEIRCQQSFGYVPDDLSVDFKPLRILSAEQEENVKSQKFNRLLSAKTSGLMSVKEFKEACNRDNLLSIQLDPSVDVIDMGDPTEAVAEATKAPKSGLAPKEAKT